MRDRLILLAAASIFAFAIMALADEPRRVLDMSRMWDAGADPARCLDHGRAEPETCGPDLADIPITRTPADPPPLVERSQWVFDLRWDRGDVWLLASRPLELPEPRTTPRVMGRFALELYEGAALIERVRFDFPLLGPPEPDGGISIAQKLRTRIGVIFPATKRGTSLDLLDRATGKRWAMPWPPSGSPSWADAGTTRK